MNNRFNLKRDEILKKKAEWEANMEKYEKACDDAYARYKADERKILDPIETAIKVALGDDLCEGLNISFNERYDSMMVVQIDNDLINNSNVPLKWDWSVSFNTKTKELKKDSNSRSGLDATTIDSIEYLKKMVKQLEIINKINWDLLLDVKMPNRNDYKVDMKYPNSRPNFALELFELNMEEAIESNILFKSLYDAGRYYHGVVWFGIIKDSNSQYTIYEIPDYAIECIQNGEVFREYTNTYTSIEELVDAMKNRSYRIRKTNLRDAIDKSAEIFSY